MATPVNPMTTPEAQAAFNSGPEAVLAWLRKTYPNEDPLAQRGFLPEITPQGPLLPAGPGGGPQPVNQNQFPWLDPGMVFRGMGAPSSGQASPPSLTGLAQMLAGQGGQTPYPSAALNIRQPIISPPAIQLPKLPAVTTPPLQPWNTASAGNTGGANVGQAAMNTAAGLLTGQALAKALGYDPLGAVGKGIASAWDAMNANPSAPATTLPSGALTTSAPEILSGGGGGAEAAGGVVPAAGAAYAALPGGPGALLPMTAAERAAELAATQGQGLAELAGLTSTAAPAAAALATLPEDAALMSFLSAGAPQLSAAGLAAGAAPPAAGGGLGAGGVAGMTAMEAAGPVAAAAGIVMIALGMAGIGPLAPKSMQGQYDYATQSIGNKAIQGYEPQNFAHEYPDLPGQDQAAILDRIISSALGPNHSAPRDVEGMAAYAPLLQIMAKENRYPTTLEYLSSMPGSENYFTDVGNRVGANRDVVFSGSLADAQRAGKLTLNTQQDFNDLRKVGLGGMQGDALAQFLAGQPTGVNAFYQQPGYAPYKPPPSPWQDKGEGGAGAGGSGDSGGGGGDGGGGEATGGVVRATRPTTKTFGEAGKETAIFVPEWMKRPGIQGREAHIVAALQQLLSELRRGTPGR